jgi:hypothetical protein
MTLRSVAMHCASVKASIALSTDCSTLMMFSSADPSFGRHSCSLLLLNTKICNRN